jgi:hypothetical protein
MTKQLHTENVNLLANFCGANQTIDPPRQKNFEKAASTVFAHDHAHADTKQLVAAIEADRASKKID